MMKGFKLYTKEIEGYEVSPVSHGVELDAG